MRTIIEVLERYDTPYCIYKSAYGFNQQICLPLFHVVLPNVLDADSIIEELQGMYQPFDFDFYGLRFASGSVRPAGRAWHYPRVPIGSSISADHPNLKPGAGTLGSYCSITGSDKIYCLTAGHVVMPELGLNLKEIVAPASKPYAEAIKACQINADRALKSQMRVKETIMSLEECTNLDRNLGQPLFYTTQTEPDPPYQKIDFAIVEVLEARSADNVISKLEAFQHELNLPQEPMEITELTKETVVGDSLVKLGIRTNFTRGEVIESIPVKWDTGATAPLDPDDPQYKSVPLSLAHAVIGEVEPDGTYLPFALPGDSGSGLLCIREDEHGYVKAVELVGMVYAVVWEEPANAFVTCYLPYKDVERWFTQKTGSELSLVVPTREEREWTYQEVGKGRSTYDLK